ncbi:MAG: hypothetical protein KC619_33220 [Myxococcales bacterium]|nr:hypothetical protein [Myxococcales bacterium]
MRRRFLVTCALLGAALLAPDPGGAQAPRVPLIHAVEVERPEALAHFGEALRDLQAAPTQRRVRVLHWGDSNVAADLWTAVTRDALQSRYGHGGSGYLVPRTMGSWHRGPVHLSAEGWAARRRGFARDFGPADGRWGLAGVAMEPTTPGAILSAEVPEAGMTRDLEVHLLGRPRPGRVELRIDEGPWEAVSLHRSRPELVVIRRTLDGGAHHVRLRHAGGVPRVLGLVVDRRAGVVYDVLGINGHRASAILSWDEGLLAEQLASRAPDLVVLSYGGNEALDPNLSMETYESQTDAAIARIRTLAPGASCLLVGPLATFPEHAPRMSAVAAIQRQLAVRRGCAFWDSAQTSGGPGTLSRWARYPGMVGRDHLHLGRVGYEAVGRGFVDALLRGARVM